MYYNIKIKSQKSEFILESNDKNVTQREMDIYFAYIFDAGEEFTSKIKKVEVRDANVKSIEEIEQLAKKMNQPSCIDTASSSKEEIKTPESREKEPEENSPEIQNEKPEPVKIQEIDAAYCKTQTSKPEPMHTSPVNISQTPDVAFAKIYPELVFEKTGETIKIGESQNIIQPKKETGFAPQSIKTTDLTQDKIQQVTENREHTIPNATYESIKIASNDVIPAPAPQAQAQAEIQTAAQPEVQTEIKIETKTAQEQKEFDAPEKIERVERVENNLQDENQDCPKTPANDLLISNDDSKEQQEPKTEIDEIIALAQNEIDSIDIDSDNNDKNLINVLTKGADADSAQENIIEFDLPPERIKPKEIEKEPEKPVHHAYEHENQTKLDDIFAKKTEPIAEQNTHSNQNEILPDVAVLQPQQAEKPREEFLLEPVQIELEAPTSEFTQNIPLQEQEQGQEQGPEQQIQPSLQPQQMQVQEQIQESPLQEQLQQPQTQQIQEPLPQQEIQEHPTQPLQEISNQIQPQQDIPPAANNGPVLDFRLFLASFAAPELVDEFLICAYYIKNILREESFTMKFLNSKLFPATGKIADMSIVEELISKNYLKTIETEESIKYCITNDGEGYFSGKFQS